MKKTGFGKRLLALLLAMTIFVSLVPAVAVLAAQGDIVSGETGLVGGIDTQDTISWPIKIYDYLNDGMLFEYSSAQDPYSGKSNPYGGFSYGGGKKMPIFLTANGWNVNGIDYTSAAGYVYRNGKDSYAFTNWGSTSGYANSYDTSEEKCTEVTRSIVQPTYDRATGRGTPMYLRGTYDGNVGTATKSYGWISNFARDDDQYYSKEEMRYAVVVYKTNSTYPGRYMRMYWAVSNSGYSSTADISNLNSGFGWNNDGLLAAQDVLVPKSVDTWTYVIVDMKTDTTQTYDGKTYGIAENWSKIGTDRIAGVGMSWPLCGNGEVMDISHIAYFGDETAANEFGKDCVEFDNDPGEYLGYKMSMTHDKAGGGGATSSYSAPTVPSNGSWSFTTTGGNGWSSSTYATWKGQNMTCTQKNDYTSGGHTYVRITNDDSDDPDMVYIWNTYKSDGTGYKTDVDDVRYLTLVYRVYGCPNPTVGFWLEDRAWYGNGYCQGKDVDTSKSIPNEYLRWVSVTYDLRNDLMKEGNGVKINGYVELLHPIGFKFPGFTDPNTQYMDIAYVTYHSDATQASTFATNATNYLNGFSYPSGTSVSTTVTRGAIVGKEMWNMGNNRAFTFLFASNGQGYPGNGGENKNTNGYYSYQIGLSIFNKDGTDMEYREKARSLNRDYVVDDSIIFLSSYTGEEMPYDMSSLKLGYTLHNSFLEGVMTAGLLQSGLVTYTGVDGNEYKIMNYKESTVGYLATLLRDTLVIPERDYWGYNYNFVMGSESVEYCEDIDGDGVLDTLGRTWNGSAWVDANGKALSSDCIAILNAGGVKWDASAGVWKSAAGVTLTDAQRLALTEDKDGDGHLDTVNEDKNGNGKLDLGEDLDNDGNLDVFEDRDFDGEIDPDEDQDGDGRIDVFEDLDFDGILDPGEDVDGDGKLDAPGWTWNGTAYVDQKGNTMSDALKAKLSGGLKWDDGKKAWTNNAGELLDIETVAALTEDANGNGKLDVCEDLDNDGKLDGITATWNGSYWEAPNGMTSLTEEGRAYLLSLTEDADGDGALDPSEDLDGDGHLDKGDEDIDGDGHLDVFEDLNYNGKMDKCDLATALRKDLGITFNMDSILASQYNPQKGSATAELGDYQGTIDRMMKTGEDGKEYNGLIGPYLKCHDNIETFYDAAYYLLHNLFVDNSYNQVETDYNYLVMSKGVVKGGASDGSDKEAYVFDGGFTKADMQSAIKYDSENGTISMVSADSKAMVYFSETTLTTATPFLPINGPKELDRNTEFRATGTPYFREDQAGSYDITYGGKYSQNNYNYVMAANGEFVFHYDDDLFFDFEGDDDVYLFIIGELVLDIGAAHSITKVKSNINDYVDEARSVLSGIKGYVPEMSDKALDEILPDSLTVNGKPYSKADLKRLHKLNLVDGHAYEIDFYDMERHGDGANMRIAPNIVMTDPALPTAKNAYQGTDVNGEPIEIEYGSLVDDSRPIDYEFAITNTGNTKLYKLSFGDPSIGVDINYIDGLMAFGKPTNTQFEITENTNLSVTGLNGSFILDGVRYSVTSDGTITYTSATGQVSKSKALEIVYDANDKSSNVHTLQLYQLNNATAFQDTEAWVRLGGDNAVKPDPNADTGIYNLLDKRTNRVPVAGIRVTDAAGGQLDASDLTITVEGYASYEDYQAGKPIAPISIKVRDNDQLKKFLTNLADPNSQTVEGEGIPDGKDSLYWGAGLWQYATVTVSGMWYTLSPAEQAAKVFNNTVYTSGYKSETDTVPLNGQAFHRVYSPGEAMYYQWAGHNVALDPDRLWDDVLKGCTDESNPLYEQSLGINKLNNGGRDNLIMAITDADGNPRTQSENMFSMGEMKWKVYSGTVVPSAGKRIVYFENSNNWSTVNAYYWSDSNSGMVSWPGTAMTKVSGTTNIYYVEIPENAEKIIFNNVYNGSGYQTDNLTLPEDTLTGVTVDAVNGLINVNYTSTGMHMFYVKVTSSAVPGERAMIPVSFYVTDVKDSTYVLDYGLHTEDLNTAGQFFARDELLGAQAASRAELMGVTTKQPSYLGTYSAAASKLGNINRIDFSTESATASNETNDKSVYYSMADGRYYLSKVLDTDGARISYSGSRYDLDRRMWFTPTDFMDQAYEIWMAITVHDADAGAPSSSAAVKYHAPGTVNSGSATNVIDIGTEVQMYKKVTILPATVVYYEDDFTGMKYDESKGSFTHHGNGSGNLTQSIKPGQNYGSDPTYQTGTNGIYSGNSMTTIDISNTDDVTTFTFTGTGFEIISRTNSFDSAAFVVTVRDPEKNVIKRLPIVTEFTNDITKCTHTNHNTNGYCTYCGKFAGHTYDLYTGKCTSCGAEEAVYYLNGWINGADVTDERYQFIDGSLTVQFDQDSYVYVKSGPGTSGPQFWTKDYAGNVTATSLFEFNSIKNVGATPDKLRIPGGVPVRLEMVNNGEGGLVLSYYAKLSSSGERTLYFDNTNQKWENVYIYYWADNENLVDWPGVPMEPIEEGSDIYSYVVPSGATQVIFNLGAGGAGNQTNDMTIPGDGYIYTDGIWSVYGVDEDKNTYTVYIDKPAGWENVYCHYAATESGNTTFPGVLMTPVEGETDRYTVEIPMDAFLINFSNGLSGYGNQTPDLNVYGNGYRYNCTITDGTVSGNWYDPNGNVISRKMVYFDNTGYKWNTVYAYYWSNDNTNMIPWCGTEMTSLPGTNYWKLDIPEDATWIIFNNGSSGVGTNQTENLNLIGTKPTYISGEEAGWTDVIPGDETKIVYFQNTNGWTNVYVNYWASAGSSAAADRVLMTYEGGNSWSAEIPAAATGVFFSGNETQMLVFPGDGQIYTDGTWSVYGEDGTGVHKIYFDNSIKNWASVNIHYWGGSGTGWPGVPMTKLDGNIWYAEIPANATGAVFNNGANNDEKTADLIIPGDSFINDGTSDVWTKYGNETKTTQVIYFKNTQGWGTVYAYTGDGMPGTQMTLIGDDVWSVELPISVTRVAFRSGNKTEDQSLPGDGRDYWTETGWESFVSGADRELYQVPVIRVDDLAYGTYTVTISGMPTYQEGIDYVELFEQAEQAVANTSTGQIDLQGDSLIWSNGSWNPYGEYRKTVYFKNTAGWSDVNVHYWGGVYGTDWPGIKMNHVKDDIWAVQVDAATKHIIFHNNDGTKTADLDLTDGLDLFTYAAEGGSWSKYEGGTTYTVFFNNSYGWDKVYVNDGTGDILMANVIGNTWSASISTSATKVTFHKGETTTFQDE